MPRYTAQQLVRNKKGQFVKGHSFMQGGEKGWFKKGQKPWCAGKTKKEDERIAQPWLGKKRPNLKNTGASKTMFKNGSKSWHTGTTKENNPKLRSGEDHWNWRGGVTKEHEQARTRAKQSGVWRNWRQSVFERDGYTCVLCGKTSGPLHPHHVKSFAKFKEERFAVDNGVTVCESCHWFIHFAPEFREENWFIQ